MGTREAKRSTNRVEISVCILRCVAGFDPGWAAGERGFWRHVHGFRHVLVRYDQFSVERALRYVHDEFFAAVDAGYNGFCAWRRFLRRCADSVYLFGEQWRDSQRTGFPELLHANFKLAGRRIFCGFLRRRTELRDWPGIYMGSAGAPAVFRAGEFADAVSHLVRLHGWAIPGSVHVLRQC